MVTTKDKGKNNKDQKIEELAHKYYKLAYADGNIDFSESKIEYLKRIIELCKKNNIVLHVTLSPVYSYQLNLIQNNPNLLEKVETFKLKLSVITPYCDAMTDNQYTQNKDFFEDSVHYTQEYADLYLRAIFKHSSSDICRYE
jgi:hypothetical protein